MYSNLSFKEGKSIPKKYPANSIEKTHKIPPEILNNKNFLKSNLIMPAKIGAKVLIIGKNLPITKAIPPYFEKNISAV